MPGTLNGNRHSFLMFTANSGSIFAQNLGTITQVFGK